MEEPDEEPGAAPGDGLVLAAIVPLLQPVNSTVLKVVTASAQKRNRDSLRLMIASAGGNPDHNLLQPEGRMNDGVVKFAS